MAVTFALLCACDSTRAPATSPLGTNAGNAGIEPPVSVPAAGAAGAPLVPPPPTTAPSWTAGAGGAAVTEAAGAGGSSGASAQTAGSGGTAGVPPAGMPAVNPPAAGSHGHGTGALDHCVDGFPADPGDAQLTNVEPDEWVSTAGEIDLFMPKPVLAWMHKHKWMEAHDAWHNVRRCMSFLSFPHSPTVNICDEHPDLIAKHQECSGADDGYAFLVEHRHMLNGFKQAFPQHTELFVGFEKFPFDAQSVPEQWRDRFSTGWSAQIRRVAETLEDIENNLSMFPTEGDLGYYMQCGGMGQLGAASAIHTALHFKWTVSGSPHALSDQVVDLGNYMFWKLHGWIDAVWERWRIAKGLPSDDPELKKALIDQCREMHTLAAEIGPADGSTSPPEPLPKESGSFHERVRPILEDNCAACHAGANAEGGLVLGGAISSALIVRNLVGVASVRGGQFQRVLPGDPDRSWFYLKPADRAVTAGCTGTCNAQVMPPTGMVTLSQAQLEIIRSWIADGAPGPNAM